MAPRSKGHAMDPITAGLSLDSLLGAGYFGKQIGHVLCLGAGGATTAIALHFGTNRVLQTGPAAS